MTNNDVTENDGGPTTGGSTAAGPAGHRHPAAAGKAPQPRHQAVLTGTPLPAPADRQPLDQALSPEAAARVAAGLAANTTRAYTRHWATFTRWCELTGRTPLPATRETLAEYVHHLAGNTTTQYGKPPAPSTVDTMLSCVQAAHKLAGLDCDARLARTALRGYRQERAKHPDPNLRYKRRRAPEIDIAALRAMIEAIADSVTAGELDPLRAERDQLILVLGFAMMGRRSEVAALDVEDLDFSERGLTVTIRYSKTDQQAAGTEVFLKRGRNPRTCPVELARSWLATLARHGITGGPLLRGIDRHGNLAGAGRFAGRGTGRIDDETLNGIVRDAALRADLDNAAAHTFHGLRAGGATSAAEAGAAPSTIQQHGRWNSLSMVFVYWRRGTAWTNNALDNVGL